MEIKIDEIERDVMKCVEKMAAYAQAAWLEDRPLTLAESSGIQHWKLVLKKYFIAMKKEERS